MKVACEKVETTQQIGVQELWEHEKSVCKNVDLRRIAQLLFGQLWMHRLAQHPGGSHNDERFTTRSVAHSGRSLEGQSDPSGDSGGVPWPPTAPRATRQARGGASDPNDSASFRTSNLVVATQSSDREAVLTPTLKKTGWAKRISSTRTWSASGASCRGMLPRSRSGIT